MTRPERPSGSTLRLDGAQPTTVVLVRHGQTPLTVAGAYSGSAAPGPSLTAHGRTQAARAADAVHRVGRSLWPDLPEPSAVVASPLARTQETAAAVGRRLGLPVATDVRFAECGFGAWEGLTVPEIEAGWPGGLGAWQSTGTTSPPGGESYAQVGERVAAGLADLVTGGTGGTGGTGRTVVVVAHAIAIRAGLGRALGVPVTGWARLRVPPASLSVLRLWDDGAVELTTSGYPADV